MLIEHILHRKGADVAPSTPEATVADAVALLREHNIGALVVTAAEDGPRSPASSPSGTSCGRSARPPAPGRPIRWRSPCRR